MFLLYCPEKRTTSVIWAAQVSNVVVKALQEDVSGSFWEACARSPWCCSVCSTLACAATDRRLVQEQHPADGPAPLCPRNTRLLELVLSGAADLGGEALGQFLQAAGILQLDLRLPAEELLQVLQQLQPRLRLLLQALELLHQLRADLCNDQTRVSPALSWQTLRAAPAPHRPRAIQQLLKQTHYLSKRELKNFIHQSHIKTLFFVKINRCVSARSAILRAFQLPF